MSNDKLDLQLSNQIPLLGLGTFGLNDNKSIQKVMKSAMENEIFLIDTSPNYFNDVYIGNAIKTLNIDRKRIQIMHKIDSDEQLYSVRKALVKCLKRMKVDYIDFYLMHWPFPEIYLNTWKQMERLKDEGLVTNIGVCNCKPHHLEPLLNICNYKPAVNQIELHPFFTQEETTMFCNNNNIRVISYTPLARMDEQLISHPLLKSIAMRYNKTVPQIILRWNIEKGYSVIPKSSKPEHIKNNSKIFDFKLTDSDIRDITCLNINKRFRFDPDDLSRYPNRKTLYARFKSKIGKIIKSALY